MKTDNRKSTKVGERIAGVRVSLLPVVFVPKRGIGQIVEGVGRPRHGGAVHPVPRINTNSYQIREITRRVFFQFRFDFSLICSREKTTRAEGGGGLEKERKRERILSTFSV